MLSFTKELLKEKQTDKVLEQVTKRKWSNKVNWGLLQMMQPTLLYAGEVSFIVAYIYES